MNDSPEWVDVGLSDRALGQIEAHEKAHSAGMDIRGEGGAA